MMNTQIRSTSHRRRLGTQYYKKVLRYGPIAYWPLWEPSGSVAECLVDPAQNGAYTGVTLGQTGIRDGKTCPLFDAANDFVNVFSAALAAAFNSTEGTIQMWCKMFDAGVWTDGANRRAFDWRYNTSNRLYTIKPGNNQYQLVHTGVGESQFGTKDTSTVDWFHWCMTWSLAGETTLLYFNGAAFDSQGAPTAWAHAMTEATIGAQAGPYNLFYGWLAHCALWNTPLTPAQIADLAVV